LSSAAEAFCKPSSYKVLENENIDQPKLTGMKGENVNQYFNIPKYLSLGGGISNKQ